MNLRYLILLCFFGFTSQQGCSPVKNTETAQLELELDMLLSDQFKPNQPGCASIVIISGQTVYNKSFGLADTKLNKPFNKRIVSENDTSTLKSYRLIKEQSRELARKGYRIPEGKDPKNFNGMEINYGSRSSIPILTLRKTVISSGVTTKIIYAPEDDIYIEVTANNDINDVSNPIQTIFNKVLTDFFGSIDFKDNTGSRLVFYHFLLTEKVLPMGGILERGKTAHVWINGDTKNLHYTTDGSEPHINSPVYNKNILITKACELKIKDIASSTSDTLKARSFLFSEGEADDPVENITGLKPGLKYNYYEGLWSSLPDFNILVPKKTGIAIVPDLSVAMKKDSCAIRFEGYVYIEKDGMYNIYSVSDDGSKVYLNNKLIVNNDGAHGTVPEAYLIPLKKGYYPIKILYFENSGGQELQVGYWTDGNEPKPFTKDILFHKEPSVSQIPSGYSAVPFRGKIQQIPGRFFVWRYDSAAVRGISWQTPRTKPMTGDYYQYDGRKTAGIEDFIINRILNPAWDVYGDSTYQNKANPADTLANPASDTTLIYNDMRAEKDGIYIGYIEHGEWFKSTVNVEHDGLYQIDLMLTSSTSNPSIMISFLNGKDSVSTGEIKFKNTGYYHYYQLQKNAARIKLKKGLQVIRTDITGEPPFNLWFYRFSLAGNR